MFLGFFKSQICCENLMSCDSIFIFPYIRLSNGGILHCQFYFYFHKLNASLALLSYIFILYFFLFLLLLQLQVDYEMKSSFLLISGFVCIFDVSWLGIFVWLDLLKSFWLILIHGAKIIWHIIVLKLKFISGIIPPRMHSSEKARKFVSL